MPFFGELYLRSTRPFLDPRVTRHEAEFIELALQLRPGERVLDLCSGHGRHLGALAERGFRPIGLELDPLSLAQTPAPLRARCVRGDLYALPFRPGFDALYSWYASLFIAEEEEANLRAVREAASVLRPGGRMLLHGHNPAQQAAEPMSRFETRLPDGSQLLETTRYDAARDVLRGHRVLRAADGQVLEGDFLVRCPGLEDHRRWCAALGLELEAWWGDVNASPLKPRSPDLIVRIRRPGKTGGAR